MYNGIILDSLLYGYLTESIVLFFDWFFRSTIRPV